MSESCLSIIDEREITPDLDLQIRRALCACFPNDEAVFSQTRQWHGSGPAFTVICREASRIVAHVGVVHRKVSVGAAALTVGGVQNVFVLPDCRGRGLVDDVMASSMQEASRRSYDCGLLFCVPELEKVYRRCGWHSLGERQVIRVEDGKELPLPGRNIAMWYPLRAASFPAGTIHLGGNDW